MFESRSAFPVMIMTIVSRCLASTARSTSIPDIPGMRRSARTIWNLQRAIICSATSPRSATATSLPAARSVSAQPSRMLLSSSTTRIRIAAPSPACSNSVLLPMSLREKVWLFIGKFPHSSRRSLLCCVFPAGERAMPETSEVAPCGNHDRCDCTDNGCDGYYDIAKPLALCANEDFVARAQLDAALTGIPEVEEALAPLPHESHVVCPALLGNPACLRYAFRRCSSRSDGIDTRTVYLSAHRHPHQRIHYELWILLECSQKGPDLGFHLSQRFAENIDVAVEGVRDSAICGNRELTAEIFLAPHRNPHYVARPQLHFGRGRGRGRLRTKRAREAECDDQGSKLKLQEQGNSHQWLPFRLDISSSVACSNSSLAR